MKSALLMISLLLGLSLNISASNELKTKLDYKTAEIKRNIEQAKSSHALWRDTLSLYQTAQDLIIKKDYAQANKVLDDVLHQLQTAHQQAMQQNSQSIIPLYLKN